MIWAAFGYHGKTDLYFINNNLDSKGYIRILRKKLLPNSKKIGGKNWIFQQDNSKIHTSGLVEDWFCKKGIEVLDWPSSSPNLNPIENLWGILARRVYKKGRQFENKGDLEYQLIKTWEEIDSSELRTLIDPMIRRLIDVIKNQGQKTKY